MISKSLDLNLLDIVGDIRTPKNQTMNNALPTVGCTTVISCGSCEGTCMGC